MQPDKILTVDPGEGDKLMIAGGEYRIIVSGKQTGGNYAVIEMTVPPGAGPNPHSHADFEETFYILEGEVTVKSESGSYVAKEHSFIAIPKGGIVHGFKNLGHRPAKLLCTVTPAGLDDFFIEASVIMQNNGPADSETDIKSKMDTLAEKFGQKLYSPDYLD